MKILVTGGTGFLGGWLLRRLVGEDHHVRVLARSPQRAEALAQLGVEIVVGDLTDAEAVRSATRGMDAVYHCGAQVEGAASEEQFLRSNVDGTRNVLRACKESGVRRLVHVSSIGVYGPTDKDRAVITEDTAHDPVPEQRGAYSHSKILADQAVREFAGSPGLSTVIFRAGFIYGRGRPLPTGFFAFDRGGRCIVIGSRAAHLPLSYVENLVDALVLAGDLTRVISGEFNIVDDETLTLRDYYLIRARFDGTKVLFLPGWPFLTLAQLLEVGGRLLPVERLRRFSARPVRRALEDTRYDCRRVREVLGWRPRFGLEEALLRMRESPSAPEAVHLVANR